MIAKVFNMAKTGLQRLPSIMGRVLSVALSRGLALGAWVALSPITLLTAVLILVFMGRPILFTQNRLGLRRQLFTIYKFRTMQDGQVTSLGRVLRATGLDELPQCLNILRGDMRWVGPRPLTPADVERLKWTSAYHDVRWLVAPGLTGPAQLSPRCHAKLSWHADRQYARHPSFCRDGVILLQSVLVPVLGKPAVKRLIQLTSRRNT
jgi:lipopolysaccharide/colanic/teichoic acid biosynthesis glycosyltransferase